RLVTIGREGEARDDDARALEVDDARSELPERRELGLGEGERADQRGHLRGAEMLEARRVAKDLARFARRPGGLEPSLEGLEVPLADGPLRPRTRRPGALVSLRLVRQGPPDVREPRLELAAVAPASALDPALDHGEVLEAVRVQTLG